MTDIPILLAQCKAYHTIEDIIKEIENLLKIHSTKEFDLHISLPYSFIEPISQQFPDKFQAGAEIFPDADEGNFTASIASKMLQEVKATFALIGTTDDRTSHSKSSNHLKNKIKSAIANQIKPFICIADTLQEHQDKTSKQILIEQIKDCLADLSKEQLEKIHLVYNAEWISRTPWETTSPELLEAYTIFREAVDEALEPGSLLPRQLIVAIPTYSSDVSELIKSLKTHPHPFFGYSLGTLSSSAEFLQPLIAVSTEQKIDLN